MLSRDCIRYVETICYPELCALGYEFVYQAGGPDKKAIEAFEEPTKVTHEKFGADYSRTPAHIEEEILRLDYLQEDIDEEQQRLWYIFPDAYQALRAMLPMMSNDIE